MQYDRVVYLLAPNDVTVGLRRKKVRIHDYPDGTIAIKYDGSDLPYSVFDKVRQVKQADIVSNKRLGAVLKHVQQQQQIQAVGRSQKSPTRRGVLSRSAPLWRSMCSRRASLMRACQLPPPRTRPRNHSMMSGSGRRVIRSWLLLTMAPRLLPVKSYSLRMALPSGSRKKSRCIHQR